MFHVTHVEGAIPTLELRDDAASSLATLAPSRGGLLTRLQIAGREILYLDRGTFEDRAANVRGGVPVLFPSPGRLTGDAWSRGGAHGAMKQHGFARNLPWEVTSTSADGDARAALLLRATDATRAQYPWDFRAEYTYSLRGWTARIDLAITNEDRSPMPFGAGFHPYFAIPDAEKPNARIATRASRVFDNVRKQHAPFSGFDLAAPELDLHLVDHGSAESSIEIADDEVTARAVPRPSHPGGRVVVRASPEFTHWVVWTLKGRDFVCLEPWTCPGDALNTGDRLIVLAPGETRSLWVEIACT
jgi:galactose mutarotase-like enzyme